MPGTPDVYALRFARYDPVAIGRGRSDRAIHYSRPWSTSGLYLFYSEQTRAAFIDTAERKWLYIVRSLGQ